MASRCGGSNTMKKWIISLALLGSAIAQTHIKVTTADITNLDLPSQVSVESFGAVGDWNGSTGTDNTTAIQNCLNSLTSGVCTLQAKAYKITGALSIAKSNVGLTGVLPVLINTSVFTTPQSSVLVSTSASADI